MGLRATWLGRRAYLETWRLQEAIATRARAGGPDRLLLVEHPPVYTIGRSGSVANLLITTGELRELGAEAYRVDRGGDITYHGPGQLVGYPVIALGYGPDLVAYVRSLEEALGAALATYGVAAIGIKGKTGVWVARPGQPAAKIAAIGVRVSCGVSTHGFALNVAPDLAAFERMIPCGFAHDVTSLAALGVAAPLREVAERCAEALAARLGRNLAWDEAVEPARDEEIGERAPVREARDLSREVISSGARLP